VCCDACSDKGWPAAVGAEFLRWVFAESRGVDMVREESSSKPRRTTHLKQA